MNVFIVNGNQAYRSMFESFGGTIVTNIEEADLVCFTGGEDVSPNLYGDDRHPKTGNNPYRDDQEIQYFHEARERNIPMVGICRGAQFLNVMGDGRLYQHVTEHRGGHMIQDHNTGEQIFVSSTHHQMMMPSEKAEIIATAALGGTREWYDGHVFKRDVSNTDYEVVYYREINSLCFQPHPEFTAKEYEGMRLYFDELLNRYLGV